MPGWRPQKGLAVIPVSVGVTEVKAHMDDDGMALDVWLVLDDGSLARVFVPIGWLLATATVVQEPERAPAWASVH